AALAASAAVVVRFLVGLAAPHPPLTAAGGPEVIAAVAAVRLPLLERFTAALLPPGYPELLLLVTRISCEWARRMAAEAALPPQRSQREGAANTDTPAAATLAGDRARAACCRTCCIIVLAVLRERSGVSAAAALTSPRTSGGSVGGGTTSTVTGDVGGGCAIVAAALRGAVSSLLEILPALVAQPTSRRHLNLN
ncbi:hypothetical protein Vafri_15145, partial [Volvox africanus]